MSHVRFVGDPPNLLYELKNIQKRLYVKEADVEQLIKQPLAQYLEQATDKG